MGTIDDGAIRRAEALLRDAFAQAVEIAQPRHCLAGHLPSPPRGRTFVIGAGKASSAMAGAFEALWPGDCSGIVLTRHGHRTPTRAIEIVEAGHPVPDEPGFAATQRVLALLAQAGPDDLIIGLFSGGGSSLLCAPAGAMTLADKQAVNRALLACGAPIGEMNVVRKHLSRVKGGRLALAAPRTPFLSLIMSDVPGDDPSTIASGPTVGDASTLAEAREIVRRWQIDLPPAAQRALMDEANETPVPGDPRLAHVTNRLVMTPAAALEGAAEFLRAAGIEVVYLGDAIEGEARNVGAAQAEAVSRLTAADRPVCLLSGGETTVTLAAKGGRGGRNSEYLLGLALATEGRADIVALAADTDGIDGSEDNAGAVRRPDTLAWARAAGIDPADALARNAAYGVFAAADALVVTGPTHTNVNDFRAVMLLPPA